MLDASDVLVVLDQFDQAGLVAWLDGGWGVDALLGHQSRPHEDLDLVIARDDCAAAEAALAGLGSSLTWLLCLAGRLSWSWSTSTVGGLTCTWWSSTATAMAGRSWVGAPGAATRRRG
jgi:hypothetical protein